jgi:hypothetical protein
MNQLEEKGSDFVFKVLDPSHYTHIVHITLSLKYYKEYLFKACGEMNAWYPNQAFHKLR